tara:strand:- start:2325 stop:4877 length:2553 start_codon:yes stop_codon:yes gene_type:complete
MAKQQFTTHRELGDALLRQFPNEYEGQNPYRLGKKYAERNPETVEVTGDVEVESDFLQTASEALEGMYELGSGVVSDVYGAGKDAFEMATGAAAGTPPIDKAMEMAREARAGDREPSFPFLRSLVGLGKGTIESGITEAARAAGLPEETISGIKYASTPSEFRAGEELISTFQEQTLEPYSIKQRPFRALANLAAFFPTRAAGALATKAGVSAPHVAKGTRILGALNPDNILTTGIDAAKLSGELGKKAVGAVTRPVRDFTKRATTDDKSFLKEVATNIVAFTTSRSPEAIDALSEIIGDANKVDDLRKFRTMPKQKLYDTVVNKFSSAVKSLRKKGSAAYKAAETKLAPVLARPMDVEVPNSVRTLQDEIINLVEDKQGTIKYVSSEKVASKKGIQRRAPKVPSMSLGQAIKELGGVSVSSADSGLGEIFKTDSGRVRKYLVRLENEAKKNNKNTPGLDQLVDELKAFYPQFNIQTTDELMDALMSSDDFFELRPIDPTDLAEQTAAKAYDEHLASRGIDAEGDFGFGEDYAFDSKIKVSFANAPIIPTTTDLKGPISKILQDFLNLDPAKVTGMELHNMRKDLDKFIENLPGDGSPGDVYNGSYRLLTDLRTSISNALENTYKEPYINAMKDYKNIIDLRKHLFDSFGVRGNVLDEKNMERISGEVSLTFSDNPRHTQRPERLKKLAEMTNMVGEPDLYTAIVGATFTPFISKGLAQRAVQSAMVGAITGGTYALTADAFTAGLAGLATYSAQQILYSPRLFSEAMLTAGGLDIPTKKAKQVIDRVKSSPVGAKIMRDNPSFPVAVERLKNEAGIDVESILASEENEENRDPKLLRNLSTIGKTQPVR